MPLPEELPRLLVSIHANVVFESAKATIVFKQLVQTLRAGGMSDAEIKALLLKDFVAENGVYFGIFRNAIKEQIAGGLHQAYELGVVERYRLADPEGQTRYQWTTVGDRRTCEDCEGRAGQVRGLDEWKRVGLPKSGFSRCGRRCRCEITPTAAAASKKIEMPNA